jgi:hypothetical protein
MRSKAQSWRISQRRKKIKVEALEKSKFFQAQEESTQGAQKSTVVVKSAGNQIWTIGLHVQEGVQEKHTGEII